MLEKTITNGIIKALNASPRTRVWKRRSDGSDNNNGMPDITGHYTHVLGPDYAIAVRIELEVKKPGEKPRKLQLSRLRRLKEEGAIAGWVTSVEEARKALDNAILALESRTVKKADTWE